LWGYLKGKGQRNLLTRTPSGGDGAAGAGRRSVGGLVAPKMLSTSWILKPDGILNAGQELAAGVTGAAAASLTFKGFWAVSSPNSWT